MQICNGLNQGLNLKQVQFYHIGFEEPIFNAVRAP